MKYPQSIFVDSTESATIVDKEDVAPEVEVTLARIGHELDFMKHKLNDAEYRTSQYISAEEIEPIKKIVYGLTTMILLAVVGALLSLVLTTK